MAQKVRMTSRIGNKGFTLIEVMVATAVLSLGAVLISESFFISLDSFDYYANYLTLASWADEKLWGAQDQLSRFGNAAQIQPGGRIVNRNKDIGWSLSSSVVDEAKGLPSGLSLYRINLDLSWQEGHRKARLSRSAYALYEKKE